MEQGLQDGHVDVLVLLGANVKHGDLFRKRAGGELINTDVPPGLAGCSESPSCVKHSFIKTNGWAASKDDSPTGREEFHLKGPVL